jgi:signal transduction histidine kinase
LLSDTPLDSEQSEHVEGIKLSTKILLTIANDVLDFSKIESGRLDIETIRFRPYDNVSELAKLLRCSVSSKPFKFECHNELPPNLETLGDPGRIRQVLSNLLTNSFKFTERGYVWITASLKQADEAAATVQFVIEDTGVGMDENVLKNLFQPFRQGDVSTARLYGGTGLGLTICKQAGFLRGQCVHCSNKSMQLLTLMHGQIAIESTVGVGSKATVTIPMQIARKVGTGGLPTPPQEQLNPLDDVGSSPSEEISLSPAERLDTHILLVEDKCVLSVSSRTLPGLQFSLCHLIIPGRELQPFNFLFIQPLIMLSARY